MISDIEACFDPNFTDKNTLHSYLHYYKNLLAEIIQRKGNAALTVCEVGIQRGGSAVGWLKLLPGAKVFGIDCVKTIKLEHPNFTELILNAYDEDNLAKFPKNIDFFVEDGSHAYSDMLFAIKNYPNMLSEYGCLVIEDLPDASWIPKFKAVLPAGFNMIHLDIKHERHNRFDNQLLIIRRDVHSHRKLYMPGANETVDLMLNNEVLQKMYISLNH